MSVQWIGSVHKSLGRRGFKPEAVVIHIMEGTLLGTDAWFNNPASKVSAHYGIGQTGQIHQYVMEQDTAWHAGRKSSNAPWPRLKPDVNPNWYTVGIEHEGGADTPWSDAIYQASSSLIKEICLRWNIPILRDRIIGHREIYTVKTCPGSQVDLDRLVSLAAESSMTPAAHNFVPQNGQVQALLDLNIRQGSPTTAAPKIGLASAGTVLDHVGWTSTGQAVDGNPHWYVDDDGNYFWAGGTSVPLPGLG